jgi:DNA-binding SARP family transcriptional activator
VDGAAATLEIRLFGDLEVRRDGRIVDVIESPRARELIARVILAGGSAMDRQRLAFETWPDSTEAQARTNLRHVLHNLRGAHPELAGRLVVTPASLAWPDDPGCRVDVAEFEAELARARRCAEGSDEALAHWKAAIALYRSDLLPGSYADWAIDRRAELRAECRQALAHAIEAHELRGEHGEALDLARALVRLDPLDERAQRGLMEAHVAAGEHAAALRVYHEHATNLARELGATPDRQTTQLYERIGRSAAGTPVAVVPGSLVGRVPEWASLTAAWRDAERGQRRLALIRGEPGIGKTRLAEELARWSVGQGAVSAISRAYEHEGELSYGVVVDWLRELGTDRWSVAPARRRELARVLPELAEHDEHFDTSAGVERRRLLFEAVAEAIDSIGRPVLLVVDDAQWCDDESLELVHFLLRSRAGVGLLVVVTARPVDIAGHGPVDRLLESALRTDRGAVVELARLDRAETAELVADLGGPADDAVVGQIFDESEGNPLFVVETVRHRQTGREARLPPKLHSLIAARLAPVSDEGRSVLSVTAVAGRDVDVATLRDVSGLDETSLARSIDELWRRGLVRERGVDSYDFTHGKIREVAYEQLSPPVRTHLHRRLAGVLAARAGDSSPLDATIASHFERAGDVESAITWLCRAATWSQRVHAARQALGFLMRADDLVARLDPGRRRDELEHDVLRAMPTVAMTDGFASERLLAMQQRTLRLARALGRDPDPSLLRSLVMTNLCRRDFDAARRASDDLHAAARAGGDAVLAIEAAFLLGVTAFWSSEFPSARDHFEAVIAEFDPRRRDEHLMRFGQDPRVVCASRLANTLWFLGDAPGARAAEMEALALAGEVSDPYSRSVTLVFSSFLALDLDDRDLAERRIRALEQHVDHRPVQVALDCLLGYVHALDGRRDRALEPFAAALTPRSVDEAPGQQATTARIYVAVLDALGDPAGTIEAVDLALAIGGPAVWHPAIRAIRARAGGVPHDHP